MSNACGLIILGNSGVGKSFLANIILGKEHFQHDFSARSVTHRTESIICRLDDRQVRVYNIPGLIEGNEERITLNRREITRAFEEQNEHSVVVMYVFGHQNGRIRNEDLITFRAIHNAYTFSSDSLIIVINGLPRDRPKTYNEETEATLIDLLGMKPNKLCFIDRLIATETQQIDIRQQLTSAILNVRPRRHIQTNDIHLLSDDVSQLQADLNQMYIQLENDRSVHEDIITNMEQEVEAAKCVSTKVNLHRLATFREEEDHLINIIEQWEEKKVAYGTSKHYRLASTNKQNAQEQLEENSRRQRETTIILNVYEKEIEQVCFELEQIYGGQFDRQHQSIREYYILFDDLRFDSTILNVEHDFLNDLYSFTYIRYGQID
ncbi:unnamed protein product [Adineta steineri]|uniref:AIG1-type G domain-containing protein n=1 Tax=Adineta steineri TaxID=433720 RepID=A0A813MH87_9BILA|nr:unnamed protein product [Adineta steineri]CAF3948200.1 unnamed protein product [Adineta steineri]